MIRHKEFKTALGEEEFRKRWEEARRVREKEEDDDWLDIYEWVLDRIEGNKMRATIKMDDWYAKHYADESLADFISQVIEEGDHSILEFCGEDGGTWGYYITRETVKEIEYVKMVDGQPIDL